MNEEDHRPSKDSAGRLRITKPSAAKDGWDKAAIAAQVFASVVLAVFGSLLTAHFQSTSERESREATSKTILSDYLSKVVSSNGQMRSAYIDALDVELGPHYSVPLAIRLSKPAQMRDSFCDGQIVDKKKKADLEEIRTDSDRMSTKDLLQRLSLNPKAKEELQAISKSGNEPDAGIANVYLGNRSSVSYKVTEVDDFADAEIDHTHLATYKFGDESPWVYIPQDKLARNTVNQFFLVVKNVDESAGARLQMRIGADQYDRYVGTLHNEPPGRMFYFLVSIPVDANGIPRYNGGEIQPLEGMYKREKCR